MYIICLSMSEVTKNAKNKYTIDICNGPMMEVELFYLLSGK